MLLFPELFPSTAQTILHKYDESSLVYTTIIYVPSCLLIIGVFIAAMAAPHNIRQVSIKRKNYVQKPARYCTMAKKRKNYVQKPARYCTMANIYFTFHLIPWQ